MSDLFATESTLAALEGERAVVFMVGGYDGSGNFGDMAMLQAGVDLVGETGTRAISLPVLEIDYGESHRGHRFDARPGFDQRRVCYFGAEEPVADGDGPSFMGERLRPATLPTSMVSACVYLYGGGYLNSFWGPRKLAMLRAVERVLELSGARPAPVVSSGLQIEAAWARSLDAEDRALLARLDYVGVRDPVSEQAAAEFTNDATPAPVMLTGDDAMGLIASRAGHHNEAARGRPTRLNVQVSLHDWVSDSASATGSLFRRLLAAIDSLAAGRLELQPWVAYEDRRINENRGLELLREAAAGGENLTLLEPIVARPKSLDADIEAMQRAGLTIACSYHLALMSLLVGVPAMMVRGNAYYEQKASGLRTDFELAEWMFPTPDSDADELAERALELCGDSPAATEMREQLAEVAERALDRRRSVVAAIQARLAGAITERLEAELGERETQGARSAALLEDLLRRHGQLQRDYQDLLAAVAVRDRDLAQRRLEQKTQLAQHQAALAAIGGSTSWRMTAPLRRVKNRLGALRGRGSS